MADLTQRDAAIIERDRVLQFSQFGASLALNLYDKSGQELREVKRFWNRYRKVTRDNVTYFRFRVTDFKDEMSADMKTLGDEGILSILTARYRVTKVERWQIGESKIWTVTADATDAPSSTFYQQP